ncbi:hypothetical protein ALI144C_00435 [Actinosynnema sp. ALI-1.44]|nr:hypothetical protein ALI144C_00435 [Actinosynnema sp. ALI-1.44]
MSSDLLVAVGAGDEHAFAELYQRLVGTVFGIAREILRDATRAEEVTEVVFVDVWRTAGQYSPDHHGGGFEWVMAIAHRHAVVRLRSTGEARSARGSWRQVTNSKPDSTVAHSGLGALPPMQRESLELAYYGGMTYTEIGEFHHVAADRAKSLLRDALIRLRDRA